MADGKKKNGKYTAKYILIIAASGFFLFSALFRFSVFSETPAPEPVQTTSVAESTPGGGNRSCRANAGTRTNQLGRAYTAGLGAAYGRTDRAACHANTSARHRAPNAGTDAIANGADYRRTDANPGAAVFI